MPLAVKSISVVLETERSRIYTKIIPKPKTTPE